MDGSANGIQMQPLYHKADTVSPMHCLCFLSVCVFHCHLIPLQKNLSAHQFNIIDSRKICTYLIQKPSFRHLFFQRTFQFSVPHMYHYSQDKKQNDQHGYKNQNCHGLRLLRKSITASFPEHHSAYSYPAVSRYVHSCLYFWPAVHLLQKHWQSWQQ